jgi:hypothetical protein
MLRTVRSPLLSALVAAFSLFAFVTNAQEKGLAPPAPVPSQIFAAKKAFISNGGLDGYSYQGFQKLGDVNQPYNAFYAAVNSWAKYTLVSTPADADLVFEVRFVAPDYSTTTPQGSASPPLRLEPLLSRIIYDAKTHFALWTIQKPVERAILKGNFAKVLNQGMTSLMAGLKTLYTDAGKSGSTSTK